MSYSFSVRGLTKDEARAAVAAEFDKVVASQPDHAADRDAAQAAAGAFIAALRDVADGEYVGVSVSGSLSWQGTDEPHAYTGASVNVSAYIARNAG